MKLTLLALVALFIFTGCQKQHGTDPSQGISVRVKLVDHLCGDFIFQTQLRENENQDRSNGNPERTV